MTWDYADGYVVLFGGSNVFGVYSGDTWTYKSGVWTELTPLIAPEGRDSSGFAYSPYDSAVVLFGGYSPDTGGQLNDTWLFKGGAWSQLHINSPSPRWGFALAYDPNATYNPVTHATTSADVLFGGNSWKCAGVTPTGAAPVCDETWYFWFDSWTNETRVIVPQPKVAPSMIFDSQDGHLILFGGSSGIGCLPGGMCQDTWEYNWSAGWVQLPTSVRCGNAATGACVAGKAPTPREEAAFAYDFTDGYAILYGGRNSTTDGLTDTWKYLSGVWTKLATTYSPDGRSAEALTYDFSSGDGYLLIVGGLEGQYLPADLDWEFSLGQWNQVTFSSSMGPGATEGGAMTYDTADGYVLYYGGYVPATGAYSTETWAFKAGVWTQLFPGTSPFSAQFASMAYDPTAGYVLLFGGNYYGNLYNYTWGFQGGNWFNVCSYPCVYGYYPPAPREGAGMAFDQASGTMVLFGGYGGRVPAFYHYQSDTWAFYVSSTHVGYWYNYTSYIGPSVPGPRALPGMTWDQADREIVLFGGGNASAVFQDTWVMTDLYGGWYEVGTCGGPGQSNCAGGIPNRAAGMVFTYDSANQGVVMSGGDGSSAFNGYILSTTAMFKAGQWYICTTYECQSYYTGLGTFDSWGAAAYDPADGYTVTAGGESWFYNSLLGLGTYFWMPVSWAFAQYISTQGPVMSPTSIDLGQSVTFSVGATGGGVGTYTYVWEGLPQGCVPPSPQSTSFSCPIQYPGFKQYYNYFVYGSYFEPSVTVLDSSGYPSYNSYQASSSLNVAPDPVISINSSRSSVDAGQTSYLGLSAYNGWGPLNFIWTDLPPGCAVVNTTSNNQLVKCGLLASSIGNWAPDAYLYDSTGYTVFAPALTMTVYPAPTATGIVANTIALDAGQTLSLGIAPSGGTGTYTYSWSNVPSACLANAAVLSCVVPGTEIGNYVPSVTVRDSNGATFSEAYAGTIVISAAPTATAVTVTNASSDPTASVDVGQSVTISLTSTVGSGGATIVWSGLPSGCTASGTDAPVVTCSPTGPGTYAISAVITDSNLGTATSPTTSLTVSPALSPLSVAASSNALDIGQTIVISTSFSGGSGSYTYRWSGLPTGCVAPSGAGLSCAVTAAGSFTPSVTVRDSNGGSSSAALSNPIVVSADPSATSLTATNSSSDPTTSIDVGQSVTFTLASTSGSGGDTIVWTGLPSGCSPVGTDATQVSCSPAGTGAFTVSATLRDSNGVVVTSPSDTLTISSALSLPTVAATSSAVDVGQTVTLSTTFNGGSGGVLIRWASLPTGCVTSGAASLTCTVTAPGSYTPSVTLRDSNGGVTSSSLGSPIVVSAAPSATALTVTNASSDPTGSVDAGQAVTIVLSATGGSGGDTILWTGLPAGCAPSGTDSLQVSCSPTGVGDFGISAALRDSNGVLVVSPEAILVVAPPLTAPMVTVSANALDVGQTLTISATSTGGSGGSELIWSGLPTGCVATSAPSLTCTVSASGTFDPSVVIRDSNGATGHGAVSAAVVVSHAPSVASLEVVDHTGAVVASVATGTTVTFTLALSAGAGAEVIVWSGLPAGCAASGTNATTVACAPTGAGTYSVSARVTDANGISATSPMTALQVYTPAAPAPFATGAQWVEMGLLVALLVLAALALILAMRRPGRPVSSDRSPSRRSPPPEPAPPAAAPTPEYMET